MSRNGALRGDGLSRGMRVGLFGGSFDPPHAGHLHVAQTAMRRLGLDQVWWLVSPQNPLKATPAGDFDRRFEAVRQIEDRVEVAPEGEEQTGLVVTEASFRGQQALKRLGG